MFSSPCYKAVLLLKEHNVSIVIPVVTSRGTIKTIHSIQRNYCLLLATYLLLKNLLITALCVFTALAMIVY